MSSIICKSCANGCVLTITSGHQETVVSGSFCPKGVSYAYRNLKGELPSPFRSDSKTITSDTCAEVLTLWGYKLNVINRGLSIQGSPERSLFRTVLTTHSHGRFILEEINTIRVERRESISRHISSFEGSLPVVPYECGLDGEVVQEFEGRFWMLHPYIEHVKIDRSTFWKDEWRGRAVGEMLTVLQKKRSVNEEVFSVEMYINDIVNDIKKVNPEHMDVISPFVHFLNRELFPQLKSLPVSFCHGDAHPLNMLWSKESIIALIDWEFCGIKPRIYDLALIIGCVGSEDSSALNAGFNRALIETVKSSGKLTIEEWKILPALVIALRFNWLSEWLRRNDEEMVSFELFYMQHLLNSYYPEYAEET